MSTITRYQREITKLEGDIQSLAQKLGEQLKSKILSQTLESAQTVFATTLQQTSDGDSAISSRLAEVEALFRKKEEEYQAIKWCDQSGNPYVDAIDFKLFKLQLQIFGMMVFHHEHFVITQVGDDIKYVKVKSLSQSLHLNHSFCAVHIHRIGGRA